MKTPQEKQQPAPLTGDEILRRMLNTPPQPHEAKPAPKPATKKTPARSKA